MKPTDHNRLAWERLAHAGFRYTRPEGRLPKTKAAVRRALDPRRHLSGMRLNGSPVLVLAGGGGLHGVMFAKLGAVTTVFDISRAQVATVRALARRCRVAINCVQGDMNDLSRFRDNSFNIVWHIHSLVFVPDARRVLLEVGRVLPLVVSTA
jgi:ubiquinone/menaquinone biosynthesis C-methylase UbiE